MLSTKALLAAHDENDEDIAPFHAVEDSTWRHDQLPIGQVGKLWHAPAGFRILNEPLDAREHLLDETRSGIRLVEGDVVGDGLEVSKRGLGLDQARHRFIRFAACSWLTIRPCWIARSPRAMPSNIRMRACCSS